MSEIEPLEVYLKNDQWSLQSDPSDSDETASIDMHIFNHPEEVERFELDLVIPEECEFNDCDTFRKMIAEQLSVTTGLQPLVILQRIVSFFNR